MNKKAQFELARKTIYWMIAGVVITIVVIAFALIIANYQGKLTKVPSQLRADLIVSRFVNAPECFAYEDERVYPGVIDLNKFNKDNLMSCYQSGSAKTFNFQLVLDDQKIETDEWFNKVDYTLFKSVLVKEGDEMKSAKLKIYVQEKI